MDTSDLSLDRAISAERESKYTEFIEQFDPNQAKDWAKLLKK